MNALLERVRLWLGGRRRRAPDTEPENNLAESAGEVRTHHPEPDSSAHLGEHGAAHPEEDPEDLHHGRRRLKESHTSHWDLDYMSREEMEKLAEANRDVQDKNDRG